MEKWTRMWFNIYVNKTFLLGRKAMKTKVKVAVQMKAPGVPGWPCINYDYDKELARVMEPVYAKNSDIVKRFFTEKNA